MERLVTQNNDFYFLGRKKTSSSKIKKDSIDGMILGYLLYNRNRLVHEDEMSFASKKDIEKLKFRLERFLPNIERTVTGGQVFYRYNSFSRNKIDTFLSIMHVCFPLDESGSRMIE